MIGICIGLIAFWMNNVESLQWLGFIVVRLFSGEFIPLEFFGASFMSLSAFLPFQFLRFLVIKLFIFNSPIFALRVIAGQLIWILVLAIIFNIGWNRAMKSFGAVGG
jgi:ABC-2 type transport system permease protein